MTRVALDIVLVALAFLIVRGRSGSTVKAGKVAVSLVVVSLVGNAAGVALLDFLGRPHELTWPSNVSPLLLLSLPLALIFFSSKNGSDKTK